MKPKDFEIIEKQTIIEKPVLQQPTQSLPAPSNSRIFSPLQASFVVILGVVCASLIFIFVRGGGEENIEADVQFSTCREAKQAGYQELTLQQVR